MLAERRLTLSLAVSAGELNPAKEAMAIYLLLLPAPNHQKKEDVGGGGGKPWQSKWAATECNGNDGCCSKVRSQCRILQRLLHWRGFALSGVGDGVV
jgi:hypothetical protein